VLRLLAPGLHRCRLADGHDGSGELGVLLEAASISVRSIRQALHLAVHLFHALAHLQDDGDAAMLTPRSRARLRMNSRRSRSSSV